MSGCAWVGSCAGGCGCVGGSVARRGGVEVWAKGMEGEAFRRMGESFHDAVDYLLSYQYLKVADGSVHQVVVGSGMGLLSSDDISSYSFYMLVETWILEAATIAKYGILLFLRFKDDALYCLDCSRELRIEFFHEIRRIARFLS